MRRRVAIVQSSYVPWMGYFAIIARCDAFIFLDSVQFTRRDWRSRNRIKTQTGVEWLSVPVRQKGNYRAPIDSIEIAQPGWGDRHLRRIQSAYQRAVHFRTVFPVIAQWFDLAGQEISLSAVNRGLISAFCRTLGIDTLLMRDVDLILRERLGAMEPTQRLVALTQAAGATEYLSGPTARNYLKEETFHERGLTVSWMDYATSLGPYPQIGDTFEPQLSILDPALNIGFDSLRRTLLRKE